MNKKPKFSALRILIVISVALLAVCCNQSSLTNKDLIDISVIKAEIEIHQNLEKQGDNYTRVELYDSDNHEIRNDTVKVFINGTKLDYTIKDELYYTKDYYYLSQNVTPMNNKFRLEIELPNGKRFFLAEIKALKTVEERDVVHPKIGNLDKDFVFSWKNMGDVNQLIIEKSIKTTNPTEPTVTSYNSEMDTVKISNIGRHVILKAAKNKQVGDFKFYIKPNRNGTPKAIER